jgi:anhydro-N-acetylmuramic acid kinase
MDPIWSVGLMTGTVLDGHIDVAMLRTDGEASPNSGRGGWRPSTTTCGGCWNAPSPLEALVELRRAGARDLRRGGGPRTRAQAEAVRDLVESEGPGLAQSLGIVGFPRPDRAAPRARAGRPHRRHAAVGRRGADGPHPRVPVAWDFRTADVTAGGQGAPLSAIYHAALLAQAGAGPDTAVLNLGGVANVTWTDGAGTLVAFDTGPANAPLNDFVRAAGLGDMDRDGALARQGRVDEARLARLLATRGSRGPIRSRSTASTSARAWPRGCRPPMVPRRSPPSPLPRWGAASTTCRSGPGG